ncbi:hypothetical protein MTR_2g435600 [Medicago truncatula]|uniref:Uncharacterized protein n=1 Tax=Medicago truncatula TaxID=3880 RepID=A0A072V746_MEDTR|nr:hypothetical protein MTR_2g435600 [Medicago truncatula]
MANHTYWSHSDPYVWGLVNSKVYPSMNLRYLNTQSPSRYFYKRDALSASTLPRVEDNGFIRFNLFPSSNHLFP